MTKLADVERMLKWLQEAGGYVHPSAVVRDDPSSGLGLYTEAPIAADERLISCPFSCAITPKLATEALEQLYDVSTCDFKINGKDWDEKMLIAAYVCLHWVWADKEKEWPEALAHRAYVDSLPDAKNMTTPLFFTTEERALLEGTNLAGAVVDTETNWRAELQSLQSLLKEDGLTWERYFAAQTYLSSRAFPSSLLRLPDGETTTAETDESHPVLLPGLDMLNHARGQPILWLSAKVKSEKGEVPAISFVAPTAIEKGSQVFNNYGAKSNESLLLGYGFVIPDNPDDTVVLRLGGAPPQAASALKAKSLDATARFTVGRDGQLPKDLLEIVRIMVGQADHSDSEEDDYDDDEHAAHEHELESLNTELDALGMLGAMLESKMERLTASIEVGNVRKEVEDMVDIYRKGQVDILNTALDKLSERVERVEMLLDDGPECPCGC